MEPKDFFEIEGQILDNDERVLATIHNHVVTEYWPGYINRDEATRNVTTIKSLDEIYTIGWLLKKRFKREK